MGKWSSLRKTAEAAPLEEGFQFAVNAAKSTYLGVGTTGKAQKYVKFRDQKDELESKIRTINVQLEALTQMMISEMEAEGMDLLRLATGETLSIKDEPYASVENREKFLAWIRANDHEDDLTVHYQTMLSMTKKRLEKGLNPPDGLKIFIKQSITKRKARG